jgi:hypothetical protein
MKVIMFVIFFLLIGAFFIISENNLKMSQEGSFVRFVGLYFSWASQIFDNSVSLAGYVVKMSWLPDENNTSG